MAYRHIVLFRIHPGVAETDIESAQHTLRALGTFPEVIQWRIERSLDTRKGTILIEDATFTDTVGYDTFRHRPEHHTAGQQLARIAHWTIGDYTH